MSAEERGADIANLSGDALAAVLSEMSEEDRAKTLLALDPGKAAEYLASLPPEARAGREGNTPWGRRRRSLISFF